MFANWLGFCHKEIKILSACVFQAREPANLHQPMFATLKDVDFARIIQTITPIFYLEINWLYNSDKMFTN